MTIELEMPILGLRLALLRLICAVACLLPYIALAGTMKVEQYKSSDVIKVFVATYKNEADLLVYVAQYENEAKGKDEIWFYSKYSSGSTHKIVFVDYKSDADLVVCIVKYKNEAKWNRSHSYVGRLR